MTARVYQHAPGWMMEWRGHRYGPPVHLFEHREDADRAAEALTIQAMHDDMAPADRRLAMMEETVPPHLSDTLPYNLRRGRSGAFWVSYRGRIPVRLVDESAVCRFIQGSYDADDPGEAWAAWSRLASGGDIVRFQIMQPVPFSDSVFTPVTSSLRTWQITLRRHRPRRGGSPFEFMDPSRSEVPRQIESRRYNPDGLTLTDLEASAPPVVRTVAGGRAADFAGVRVVENPYLPPGQVLMLADGSMVAGPGEVARIRDASRAQEPRQDPDPITDLRVTEQDSGNWLVTVHRRNSIQHQHFRSHVEALERAIELNPGATGTIVFDSLPPSGVGGPRHRAPSLTYDPGMGQWIVQQASGDISRHATEASARQQVARLLEMQNPSRAEGPRHPPQAPRPNLDPARAPRRVLRLVAEPEAPPAEPEGTGRGAAAPRAPGRRLRGLDA